MPEKKDNDEFVERCKKIRPDYQVLSPYIKSSEKVKFRHECGAEFMMTPAHFLGGEGCPVCAQKRRNEKLSSKTIPKLLEALEALGLSLTSPLTDYKNNRQLVEVRCNRCGDISKKMVGNILAGHGCKHCASVDCQPEYDITARLEKDAPEWELAGKYINMKTPALFLHKPCGMKCSRIPMNIFNRPNSCRYCNAKKLSMTHEEFLKRAEKKTDYEILSKYVNSNTKIHIKHNVCGKDAWVLPLNFLKREEGCPHCKGQTIARATTMTHDEFLEALGERAKEFVFLTRYKGTHQPIKVKHSCGYVMVTTPDNLVRRGRCLGCEKSLGEKEVYDFVKSVTDDVVIPNDRKTLPNKKELDVYLPNKKIAFEYDGLLYHSLEWSLMRNSRGLSKKDIINKSLWKTEECRKLGIRLIHIFEDEWLEKRPIVEDKIKAVLGVGQERIFARKLTVQEIPPKVANAFYKKNHIQGGTKSTVTIGLLNGEELVAAQSFKRGTRKKNGVCGSWELTRYATKLGTVVIGGFSRCLKKFEKDFRPKEVVSFADLRMCDPDNNVYEKNGFVKDEVIKPDFYYTKGAKRFHKSKFRKAGFKRKYPNIYSPNKTESQMASEAKLFHVYDCGKIRYVKTV